MGLFDFINKAQETVDNMQKKVEEWQAKANQFANGIKVYNELTTNQIFGALEVEKVLGCSTTTLEELKKKLRDMQVVIEVKGMGKGKYRLAYESEVK